MINWKRFGLVTLILTAFACFYQIGYSQRQEESAEILNYANVFARVFGKIKANHVEDVSTKDLFEAAIAGMMRALSEKQHDKYSQFLPPELYGDFRVSTTGHFGGLGIEVNKEDDQSPIKILTPLAGTPAARSGIKAGDLIVKIEGAPTVGMPLKDAVAKLRGPLDTKVAVTVNRPETGKTFDLSLSRADIPIKTVRFAGLLQGKGNVGYIQVDQFAEQTDQELSEALRVLKEKGAKSLVLDLRNNPGGLLDSAVEVSRLFLDEGLVVATCTRDNAPAALKARNNKQLSVTRHVPAFRDPMVILVNGFSASASEIVAGALSDHGRARLVGQKTYGKGSVQTLFEIPYTADEACALKLTTARYYTPNGFKGDQKVSIDGNGIMPAAPVDISEQVFKAIQDAFAGAWVEYNSRVIAGETEFDAATEALNLKVPLETDPQLAKAVELLTAN